MKTRAHFIYHLFPFDKNSSAVYKYDFVFTCVLVRNTIILYCKENKKNTLHRSKSKIVSQTRLVDEGGSGESKSWPFKKNVVDIRVIQIG